MGGKQSNEDKKNPDLKRIVTTKLVTIKIPINSIIWEKTYNIETTLDQIAKDFKNENNMDTLQEKYFIEWSFQNQPIEMDSRKLKSFINEDNLNNLSTIEITQVIRLKPGEEEKINIDISGIVGKPFFNPFEVFTFSTSQKLIKAKHYSKRMIAQTELDKFSIDSAYCNGNNHLYISGGVDPITKELLDLFWDIDLKDDNLNSPTKMLPKKNHSMIYDDKKVYIIGGNDESTLIYDTDTKAINKWANLNLKRFEPSLIRHKNYLFCFDTSRKKNDDKFSIEKINLENVANPQWEIIYPSISQELGDNVFSQKFFGVVEDCRQNIIFLGGIYDSNENNNNEGNKQFVNTRYNINRNIMEKSDINFEEISLNEKTFLPLDVNNYFILPNFSKREPKIVYFNKDKNLLKISSYKSNSNVVNKSRNNTNIKFSSQIKSSLIGLNFDMPGLHKENESPIIKMNIENEPIKIDNINAQNVNIEEANKDLNIGKINVNMDNVDKDLNIRGINKNANIEVINTDLNIGGINKNVNIEVNNKDLNIEGINKNVNIEVNNKDLNIGGINKNVNIEVNNKDLNIGRFKGNVNVEEGNKEIKTNDIQINIVNPKIEADDTYQVKRAIVLKQKPTTERSIPTKELYLKNYKNFVNFHNSVDDPCSNINKIKIRKINLPKNLNLSKKKIKEDARNILKEEINEFRNNNY